ncbi:hypothetical protein PybrP1_012671 [[Pythium] brassicae (nom. inval.)]|nr:hypothetical protein PybrP1_012671 [[Pythium] brassicae (nom. inval.)]
MEHLARTLQPLFEAPGATRGSSDDLADDLDDLDDEFIEECLDELLMLRQHIRRFSYAPPKGAGASDNSSFFGLLGIASVVGGAAYVYYDPDVLPEGVKRFLPIQEPKGHGMSLEEYEQWRAKQAGYTPSATDTKDDTLSAEEIAARAQEAARKSEEEFLGKRRPIASESTASLTQLLLEARENEAGYLAELKKTRAPLTEEDRMLLQAFKDEKARLKKQLKQLEASK